MPEEPQAQTEWEITMYCSCGSSKELVSRQEKQPWQAVGETVNYYHCTNCGRNYVPENEKKKLKAPN